MDTLTKNAASILNLLFENKKKFLTAKEILDATHLSVKHINTAVNYLTGCGAIETDFGNQLSEFKFNTIREGDYSEAYHEHFKKLGNRRDIIIKMSSNNRGNNLETKQNSKMIIDSFNEKNVWVAIGKEYNINKIKFGRRINFVKEKFKREVIFRDVGQAFYLAKNGFNKPAVILSGGVMEELLRLYLDSHNIKSDKETFEKYIDACIENKLLESSVSKLSESIRYFRNIVHLEREKSPKQTISKSTALGAVSAIFSLLNAFKPHFS